MILILSLFVFLIMYSIWEHKYSRPAKLFSSLKEQEPDTYDILCKGRSLFPSITIKAIIANNQHQIIKDPEIKRELLAIAEKQAKRQVITMLGFVLYILLMLLISAISNG